MASPWTGLQTRDIIRTRDGPMCGPFGRHTLHRTKYLVTTNEGKVKPPNWTSPWLERKVTEVLTASAVSWGVRGRRKMVERQADFIDSQQGP